MEARMSGDRDDEQDNYKGASTKFKPLSDEDLFPFGMHKGARMVDVPASYLDWLRDQDWLMEWPAVEDYIVRNKDLIDYELEEMYYEEDA